MESIQHFWHRFIASNNEYSTLEIPQHYYFCDNEEDANTCAELVVQGIKQATSTSLWWFTTFKKPLPEIGELAIITDWLGKPKAITRVTKISRTALGDIDKLYAFKEGEGDKSLAHWQKVHWEYYTREMKPFGEAPSNDMIIVCEEFETIFS